MTSATATATAPTTGLLETSVLISETGWALDAAALPEFLAVSIITITELNVVDTACRNLRRAPPTRPARLAARESISTLEALPVDEAAAREWARLRYRLAESQRRINVSDL